MIVRLISREGVQRVEVEPTTSVAQLKAKVAQMLGIEAHHQKLSVRIGAKTVELNNDSASLKSFGVENGDLVYLSATQSPPKSSSNVSNTNVANHTNSPTSEQGTKGGETEKGIEEDEIDKLLWKEDGWISRPRSPRCQHPQRGSCMHCMPIAPWDIMNHDPWKSLGLKHLPFTSWFRKHYYNNPQFVLEERHYAFLIKGNVQTSKEGRSVTLDRQEYRHVDHVEFEHQKIVDNFLEAWRHTGNQRCGFLYGTYVKDPTIPLGIRAVVAAIYEPPQMSTSDTVALLKDPQEKHIDEVAKKIGLRRIGFIWTSIKVDEKKRVIPDRDVNQYTLKSTELMRMAHLQNRYPSPWKHSTSGYFGSKFVSVLVTGKNDGTVDVSAWQVSNQCAGLVRDGVIRASKDPSKFRVRKSKSAEVLYPDIFYRAKNEYGYQVLNKADPFFPVDFCIVSLRHSFPKEPHPKFSSFSFPIENRQPPPSMRDLQAEIRGKYGKVFLDTLSDFHLLLFLSYHLDSSTFDKLINGIKEGGTLTDADVRPILESVIRKQLGDTTSATASSVGDHPQNRREAEFMQQLLLMGYSEQQAKEALWATNYSSIEQAVDFLNKT
jgi:nuclear protein localization family protein 4